MGGILGITRHFVVRFNAQDTRLRLMWSLKTVQIAQERAEESGRWSHKADGRYMHGKLKYDQFVPKKVIVIERWSLKTSGR